MVQLAGESMKLERVADSDFRFFPTIRDDTFGCILHPVDLATNKIAAAYGRREPREIVDLLAIHQDILPTGAAVWASAGGFTPEGIINEIRRVARYRAGDFLMVASDPPVDPAATMRRLREILEEAEAFVFCVCQPIGWDCSSSKTARYFSPTNGDKNLHKSGCP
jgi:hypothetical protein